MYDHHNLFFEKYCIDDFSQEVEVVETANDGYDCLNKIRRAKPDLILLDMNMPELEGH